ncbi:cation channel sperm-associated protein subunit epsilon-like isoform X1 [Scyliorhinus canicula]|uniref:cation channel sperm-associated protein subunit epsilon-like isoform X1 n=1 Tax=Scyliorhinus canicula TaxID=7830 RepID=UPI0018F67131|nr:cation channel sperm-associated protein subunit epsilon-like isoform X1 [Scyliorhinus canicula]
MVNMWRGGAAVAALLLMLRESGGVWRYYTNMEGRISLNTRSTLHLDYEGNSFSQWSVPPECTVDDLKSPSVVLSCSRRGVYTIYPEVANKTIEDSPRNFKLGAALFNFVWYMVKLPNTESLTYDYDDEERLEFLYRPIQKDELRIWVVDPEKAVSAELNKKAEKPSPLSRILTKEFFNLGQEIILTMYPTDHNYKTSFNSADGYWTVYIYNVTNEIILTVHGRPMTFEDLFIMDTSYTIEKRLDLSIIKALGYVSLKLARGKNPLIVHHPCSASSALLLTDYGTFITHDGFITAEELKIVPTELQLQKQNKVITAAFLERNILFLIGDSVYIRHEKGFYTKLGIKSGLPKNTIIGLLSRTSCASIYPAVDGIVLSSAVVWTSHNLYLLNSRSTIFTKHLKLSDWSGILRFPENATIIIGAVSFGSRPPEVGVLIEVMDFFNERRLFLTIYNEETNTWVLSTIFLYSDSRSLPLSPFRMQFIESALPTVFIWSNITVLYSLRNNSKSGKMHVNGDENLSNAVHGSTIHQIVFDHKLNILIKMVNNAMLFGIVGVNTLVKLHTWERQDSNIILYSNLLSQIIVIKLVNSVIQDSIYPLDTEVYSSLSKQENPTCPFKQFKHNLKYPVYYLDMGQSLTFWAEIIYEEEQGLQIEIIDYNKYLLNWVTNTSYQITFNFYTRTLSVLLQHKKDYTHSKNYTADLKASSGVLTVEFQPNQIEYTCKFTSRRVSHISVGCPLKKHIRVQRPYLSGCETRNITFYKIPGSALREPVKHDVTVVYNRKRFGCPIRVYYKSSFKPVLKLYMGEKFISIVSANYIIWEEQGRTDFYYNTTMREAGCLREAQTWKSMLDYHKGSHLSRKDIWGPWVML